MHKECLKQFYDENPNAYIQDAVDCLFEGLEIKKSRVHEFMKNECNLTFKQTAFWSEARMSLSTIKKRYNWVVEW
ncbi:hypothetical protein BDF20DRAFT_880469, partial [Mycotypha africana]|uniref:uncharacterized protein n=1 Tax=Mycotypha africana TaxID=64632 RepID=UPI00230075B8